MESDVAPATPGRAKDFRYSDMIAQEIKMPGLGIRITPVRIQWLRGVLLVLLLGVAAIVGYISYDTAYSAQVQVFESNFEATTAQFAHDLQVGAQFLSLCVCALVCRGRKKQEFCVMRELGTHTGPGCGAAAPCHTFFSGKILDLQVFRNICLVISCLGCPEMWLHL